MMHKKGFYKKNIFKKKRKLCLFLKVFRQWPYYKVTNNSLEMKNEIHGKNVKTVVIEFEKEMLSISYKQTGLRTDRPSEL